MSSKYSGYTQLPNIFVPLMPYLSDGEFKILYYIARQTIGFHKEKDRISFSQFQKATGVTRDTVGRTLINLKAKKLIVVNDNFEYRLDTDNLITMLDKMEATGSLDDIDSLNKYVYIIRYDTHVKIGKANNVQKRFSSLKGMSHTKIELLWYATETESINEQLLHDIFKQYRSHNEYFEYSDEIKEFIESMKDAPLSNPMVDG